MADALIELKNVSKKYRVGDVVTTVLKGVSLRVNRGEMIAIVGPSGSGKSTLMNLIGLLDKADEGDYLLNHQNISTLSNDELASLRNKHIGFVFQQFNLLPRFNTIQNVGLPLVYRKELQALVCQKKITTVLEKVGMAAFADHRPSQLSGGQQQRVAIARALVGSPEVILADEPTGALDSATGKEIMDLFLTLNHEGRTIVLVTHDEKIANQCNRILTMKDGHIIGDNCL